MIHITIVPNSTPYSISLDFPEDYLGKEIEIIAFKKHTDFSELAKLPKKFVSFDTIKIDTTDYNFNRDDANQR